MTYKELLNNIEITTTEHEKGTQYKVKAEFSNMDLLLGLHSLMSGMVDRGNPNHHPIKFFFLELTQEQRVKIVFLTTMSSSLEDPEMRMVLKFIGHSLEMMLSIPCQIEAKTESVPEKLVALEDLFGTFLSTQKFDEIHDECHELIAYKEKFEAITANPDSEFRANINLN